MTRESQRKQAYWLAAAAENRREAARVGYVSDYTRAAHASCIHWIRLARQLGPDA